MCPQNQHRPRSMEGPHTLGDRTPICAPHTKGPGALTSDPQARRGPPVSLPREGLVSSGENAFLALGPDVPVWHERVLAAPEHDPHVGGVLAGGVEVCVVTCRGDTVGTSGGHMPGTGRGLSRVPAPWVLPSSSVRAHPSLIHNLLPELPSEKQIRNREPRPSGADNGHPSGEGGQTSSVTAPSPGLGSLAFA